uniref:Ubiquitin-like protease family profile domain-containing protein n=1 Tax=Triticum urartu TaxID=4572 RepID=A0A8R7QG50_TRIUA
MNRTGVHSLRAVEEFLLRDITEESSKLEKDCFQIAFVIFVMGLVLVPKTKYDYATIDFWGALASTENIAQFNWCQYVLDALLDAVRKLKRDIILNNLNTNLTGCHLFYQIFTLDSLHLGTFNKKHDVFPRISDFDADCLRNMIIMATDPIKSANSWSYAPLRDPSVVCYMWGQCREKNVKTSHSTSRSHNKKSGGAYVAQPVQTPSVEHADAPVGAPVPISAPMGDIGPMDLGNYLRQHYPKLVADEISLLLKKHNTRALLHLANERQSIMKDMLKLADDLYSSLSRRCVCCPARGFADCPLGGTVSNHVREQFSTPVTSKIDGRRLDLSGCGAKTPADEGSAGAKLSAQPLCRADTVKRVHVDLATPHEIVVEVTEFCKSTFRAIAEMYADLPSNFTAVVFGQSNKTLPKQKYIFQHGYATDPWGRGCVPYPPMPDVAEQIEHYFNNAQPGVLSSLFIIHDSPRYIRVTGLALKQQLVGERLLDHELMCIILRRFMQAHAGCNRDSPYLTWRHSLEADLSKQLTGECHPYDITTAQMFLLPVPLQDGWLLMMWDMIAKIIHVLDPLVRRHSTNPVVKVRQELVERKLHNALFNCLNEYYAGWPVVEDNWRTVFPALTDTNFCKEESGIAVVHIARHYDGRKMMLPLTKPNLAKTKKQALFECLKLQGNQTSKAGDALWAALAPSDSCFGSYSET